MGAFAPLKQAFFEKTRKKAIKTVNFFKFYIEWSGKNQWSM